MSKDKETKEVSAKSDLSSDIAASAVNDYVASNNAVVNHDISLAEYASAQEAEAFKADLVVVSISHPQATDGDIYQGRFSGIRLSKGEVGRVLSNGDGAVAPKETKAE